MPVLAKIIVCHVHVFVIILRFSLGREVVFTYHEQIIADTATQLIMIKITLCRRITLIVLCKTLYPFILCEN